MLKLISSDISKGNPTLKGYSHFGLHHLTAVESAPR
jgi:hypothetical protein